MRPMSSKQFQITTRPTALIFAKGSWMSDLRNNKQSVCHNDTKQEWIQNYGAGTREEFQRDLSSVDFSLGQGRIWVKVVQQI